VLFGKGWLPVFCTKDKVVKDLFIGVHKADVYLKIKGSGDNGKGLKMVGR
jgi:hypothetical protein